VQSMRVVIIAIGLPAGLSLLGLAGNAARRGNGPWSLALAGELAVSERQVRRRLETAVGYGPKRLARGLRLRRALAAARAMGVAYASTLADEESFTTLELKINFLRPFRNGTLTASARVVKAGRTIGLTECDVTDTEGRLIARATSTCMTLRRELGEGR